MKSMRARPKARRSSLREQHHPGQVGPLRALGGACLAILAALACAALLAACGGSSGGASSPTASAALTAPTPSPEPLITSGPPPAAAVATVRKFWTLAGDGRLEEAKRSLVAPGSPIQDWTGEDIASARFVRVVPRSVSGAPVEGATIEFSVDVWIEETASAPNVWGDPGEHQLFEHVVRMSDGTWRMWDSGTGP
jgi:hypothetical protein